MKTFFVLTLFLFVLGCASQEKNVDPSKRFPSSVNPVSTASKNKLDCQVKDWSRTESSAEDTAELAIEDGKSVAVLQNSLRHGAFSCQVAYNLEPGKSRLTVRLFRADKVTSNFTDLAFFSSKKIDLTVQTNDLSKANNEGNRFAAGSCSCQTAN